MGNVTPGHVRVFQAVRSQLYDNITLTSCTINGEPGVAIIMIDEVGEAESTIDFSRFTNELTQQRRQQENEREAERRHQHEHDGIGRER